MTYIDRLEKMHACQPALDWLRASGHKSLTAAWRACQNGSWMDWLIVECDPKVRKARAASDQVRAAYVQARAQARAAYADAIRAVYPRPPRLP
jgi:hypothetical protein